MCRCFQPVSRTEAEMTLERHSDCGNLLIRPSRDGASLAVTTRQDLNGYTPPFPSIPDSVVYSSIKENTRHMIV